MLKDYTNQLIATASRYKPQQKKGVDWVSLADSLKSIDTSFKTNDLASALESGDEEAINKAKAALDPTGYARILEQEAQRAEDRQWALEDAERKQQNALELMREQNANAFALENLRNQNARGLAEFRAGLKNQQSAEDITSLENAQQGINVLSEVANNKNIGPMTRLKKAFGFVSEDQKRDLGQMSGAIAMIAPRAIAKVKEAGISGVNTLGEFMTYIGLPENPTSEEIAGALPLMAKIAGVSVPQAQVQRTNYANKYGLE